MLCVGKIWKLMTVFYSFFTKQNMGYVKTFKDSFFFPLLHVPTTEDCTMKDFWDFLTPFIICQHSKISSSSEQTMHTLCCCSLRFPRRKKENQSMQKWRQFQYICNNWVTFCLPKYTIIRFRTNGKYIPIYIFSFSKQPISLKKIQISKC